MTLASTDPPSDWVRRWSHLVAPGAAVLDVACGAGRHVRWFAARGARVTGMDRDAEALARLRTVLDADGADAELLAADLEAAPWPLAARRFGAVVVARYLWRPLLRSDQCRWPFSKHHRHDH